MLTRVNQKLVSESLNGQSMHGGLIVSTMATAMRRQSTRLSESFAAVTTRVRLFARVSQHVSGQRARLVELHSAHRTFVWLHSTVYQLVPSQCKGTPKLFTTSVAGETFLRRMCLLVSCQSHFHLKSFATRFTAVELVLKMSSHMIAQISTLCESFPTNTAHVISFFRVNAHTMSFQVSTRSKSFSTVLATVTPLIHMHQSMVFQVPCRTKYLFAD